MGQEFIGEQNNSKLKVTHPGRLTWPGGQYPAIGRTERILKKDEIAALPVVQVFHCHVFDLSKPEDKQYFLEIMQRACAGWFRTLTRTPIQFDPQTGSVKFYMEWVQKYTDLR